MNETIFTPGAYSPSGQSRSPLDRVARVDAPHLDAPGERVQRVARGNVVEVVGAGEAERDERVAVGDETVRVGLARVLALIGLGETHRARLDRVVVERLGRPAVDHAGRDRRPARRWPPARPRRGDARSRRDPDVAVELVRGRVETEIAVGDHGMITRFADRGARRSRPSPRPTPAARPGSRGTTSRRRACSCAPRSMTTPVSQCSASWRSITFPAAAAPSTFTARMVRHALFDLTTVSFASSTWIPHQRVSARLCSTRAPSVCASRIAHRSSQHSFSLTT